VVIDDGVITIDAALLQAPQGIEDEGLQHVPGHGGGGTGHRCGGTGHAAGHGAGH